MEITEQSTENENVCSIDRLSALPDAVLCHILSFLPTKLSVATSILAKRWRFLWALVPDLRFENENLHRELSIFDIISRVMLLYKVQSMNTFLLDYTMGGRDDKRTEFQLDTCIAAAVSRNVKILDLCDLPMLSPCIFTYKTLVELRLSFVEIPTKGRVCLPALKRLRLRYAECESDESLPNLLSGCPVLEELNISISGIECMGCWHICSSTLKILILNSKSITLVAYRLKLDTPALEYLRTEGFKFKDVSAEVLTHLIEADIDFDDDALFHCPCSTLEIFGSICNVKRLKLTTGFLKASNSIFSDLTMKFHRLTKLELAGDWRFLSCFLGNADNLEILFLHKVNTDVQRLQYWMEPEHEVNTDLQYWMEPQNEPICLSSHLRIVRIFGRLATEAEFESISYILRNAKVLEMMEICPQHNGTEVKA